MKNKVLLTAFLMQLSSFSFAGGGNQNKPEPIISYKKKMIVNVPERSNIYRFSLVNNDSLLTVIINGDIQNESILSIINLKGSEQYRQILNPIHDRHEVSIPFDILEQGIYFVKIDSEDEIRLKRLVLN